MVAPRRGQYPFVTNTAFEAFSCHEFHHDQFSVLIADVSITCTTNGVSSDGMMTSEWLHVRTLATCAICIYPVGLLLFTARLLYVERHDIRIRKLTPLSGAIVFLYKEYAERWGSHAELLSCLALLWCC
jgi:hypothetical protein